MNQTVPSIEFLQDSRINPFGLRILNHWFIRITVNPNSGKLLRGGGEF